MAAPRLRTKLAAIPTAMEDDRDEANKGKGKATDGTPVDETDEERKKREEEEEKEAAAKAAAAATTVTVSDAVAADRARTRSITGSASGKQLPTLASHLAYETDLTVEASEALFAAVLKDVEVDASASAAGAKPPGVTAEAISPRGAAFRKAMEAEASNPRLGNGTAGAPEGARMMSFHEIRAAKAAQSAKK